MTALFPTVRTQDRSQTTQRGRRLGLGESAALENSRSGSAPTPSAALVPLPTSDPHAGQERTRDRHRIPRPHPPRARRPLATNPREAGRHLPRRYHARRDRRTHTLVAEHPATRARGRLSRGDRARLARRRHDRPRCRDARRSRARRTPGPRPPRRSPELPRDPRTTPLGRCIVTQRPRSLATPLRSATFSPGARPNASSAGT